MPRINSLTAEQEMALRHFRQRWFDVGTCTDPADRPRAECAISELYHIIGLATPGFVWFDSPKAALSYLNNLTAKEDSVGETLWGSLNHSLEDSLWGRLEEGFTGDFLSDLRDGLDLSLDASLQDNIGDSIRLNLLDELRGGLDDSLLSGLEVRLSRSRWDGEARICWWGQFDSPWIALYVFPQEVLNFRYPPTRSCQLLLWAETAQSCSWWWPYIDICVISDRPRVISIEKWGENLRLHNESGPAVRFSDGWEIYALHGVRVSKWLVLTPAEDLDASVCLLEKNTEFRREIVRRLGIDRVCNELARSCLDEQDNYQLLELDLQDGRIRPYLKMLNPSTGTWHIEGVHPDCKTVAEALAWRNSIENSPSILT